VLLSQSDIVTINGGLQNIEESNLNSNSMMSLSIEIIYRITMIIEGNSNLNSTYEESILDIYRIIDKILNLDQILIDNAQLKYKSSEKLISLVEKGFDNIKEGSNSSIILQDLNNLRVMSFNLSAVINFIGIQSSKFR
jgi:hypothetical protein